MAATFLSPRGPGGPTAPAQPLVQQPTPDFWTQNAPPSTPTPGQAAPASPTGAAGQIDPNDPRSFATQPVSPDIAAKVAQIIQSQGLKIPELINKLNKALSDEWLAYYQYWIGAR